MTPFTVAVGAWIFSLVCLIWSVYASWNTMKARRAKVAAEAKYNHYKDLADDALEHADKRLEGMQEEFKKTIDFIRSNADSKISAVGREITDLVSSMNIHRTQKVKALSDIKRIIDNKIDEGY